MTRLSFMLAAVAVIGAQPIAFGQDKGKDKQSQSKNEDHWNQFRGPNGDGKTLATNLPVEFNETENVRWKIAIPGVGWSSPVVWGKQVWLTTGREDGRELFAICVDAESGKVVHNIKVFDVADPRMEWANQNPHATPTPFVEEGRVYVHYGSYGTACVDTASGEIVWKRQDLNCNHRVGPASSPIVSGDSLFLQFDGVDVQYIVALDKATGDTCWRKAREVNSDLATRLRNAGLSEVDIEGTVNEKPGDNRKSYATATLIDYQGNQQLIAPGAEVLFSYDPKTGDELWRVELEGWSWNVACRPILANGLLYATTGISKKLLAVRPDGSGNVTETHVAWSTQRSVPNMSSPLIVDDLLFMVSDNGGIASCLDAKTGEQLWRKRLGGNHWASPLYASGKIYFSSKEGDVSVLAASKEEPEMLAKNKLDASFIASPAVAGDSLILRSTTHLYCIADGYARSVEQVANDMYPKRNDRGKTSVKPKTDADWEKAYEQLLKTNPQVKVKIDSGGATKEQVILWLKKTGGQVTKNGQPGDKKGAGTGKAGGPTNFYAIVIGRLKSKDIELGEFTMDVDHVTSMYSSRWVKDEIVGKTVKVTGVSGAFRDKLLLIKRGETLKFRSGSYFADSNSLAFGFKFHVLERAKPFDPDAYGVPHKEFRGFQGVLQGKIVEVGGFEVLLCVEEVVKLADGNKATDANSIKGKLVRLTGFFQHQDKFNDLHEGDTIRVGATHTNRTYDQFGVTDVLEKVEK